MCTLGENIHSVHNIIALEEPSSKRLKGDGTFSPELLRVYYQNSFPYDLMVKWVGQEQLPYREWCFVLQGDIFCRYQSFSSALDFKKKVLDSLPVRMETGCCFSHFPKAKDSVRPEAFYPTERDIVFDVDMDEYDDIRTCCQGAKVCEKCWMFIKAAMVILKQTLEEDFGFTKMFFVYSGRRGMHCWVYDEAARKLTNEQRGGVAEYIQLINEARNGVKTCRMEHKGTESHHLVITRAVETLGSKYMDQIMEDQRPFDGNGKENIHLKSLEQLFKDAGLEKQWGDCIKGVDDDNNISVNLWAMIKKCERTEKGDAKEKVSDIARELVLQFTYPRLDINVSKTMNHLLKIPFVVHPKTGRFCVPIFDPDNFSFSEVPTLADYVEDFERTGTAGCLQPYLDKFAEQLAADD